MKQQKTFKGITSIDAIMLEERDSLAAMGGRDVDAAEAIVNVARHELNGMRDELANLAKRLDTIAVDLLEGEGKINGEYFESLKDAIEGNADNQHGGSTSTEAGESEATQWLDRIVRESEGAQDATASMLSDLSTGGTISVSSLLVNVAHVNDVLCDVIRIASEELPDLIA